MGLMAGGCGSFFNIDIASKKFIGLSKVKQHKLVQDLLKDEVAGMHGLSVGLFTSFLPLGRALTEVAHCS